MPFYRVDGIEGLVHMKGRRLPPPCSVKGCLRMSAYQCDGPVAPNRTCDRHLCKLHAKEVGKNRHHCPDCAAAAPSRRRLAAAPQEQQEQAL